MSKIKVTDINATGTPSGSTVLKGDGSWGAGGGSGGGGGLVSDLIGTYVCTGTETSITIPVTDNFTDLEINFAGSASVAGLAPLYFNGDTNPTNYDSIRHNQYGSNAGNFSQFVDITTPSGGYVSTAFAIIPDYNNPATGKSYSNMMNNNPSLSAMTDEWGSNRWRTVAAITSVTLQAPGGGTFTAGTRLSVIGKGLTSASGSGGSGSPPTMVNTDYFRVNSNTTVNTANAPTPGNFQIVIVTGATTIMNSGNLPGFQTFFVLGPNNGGNKPNPGQQYQAGFVFYRVVPSSPGTSIEINTNDWANIAVFEVTGLTDIIAFGDAMPTSGTAFSAPAFENTSDSLSFIMVEQDGSNTLTFDTLAGVTPLHQFLTGTDNHASSIAQFNNTAPSNITGTSSSFQYPLFMNVILKGTPGGDNGTTPTIRASSLGFYSSSTINVPFPSGTAVGDVAVVFVTNGYSLITVPGWVNVGLSPNGNYANGTTIVKELTSADITLGYVTVNATGSFDGDYAIVIVDGTTVTRFRDADWDQSGGSGSVSTYPVSGLPDAENTDLIIGFSYIRGNGAVTISNFTSLAAPLTSANASAFVGEFTGVLTKTGISETASFAGGNNGCYNSAVAIR